MINRAGETFLVEECLAEVLNDSWRAHGIADAANLLSDIAAALDHLHRHGLVHGDVKPDNIGQRDGRFILLDFGICRPAADFVDLATATGSLRTRAPELLEGDTIEDPVKIDTWALAATVFNAATGRFPFFRSDDPQTPRVWEVDARAQFEEELAERARSHWDEYVDLGAIDEPLRSVLQTALVRDPAERCQPRDLLATAHGHLQAYVRNPPDMGGLSPLEELDQLLRYMPIAALRLLPPDRRQQVRKQLTEIRAVPEAADRLVRSMAYSLGWTEPVPRGAVQRVQDSVHGLMEFRGLETVVIDVLRTRELQRLRRVRQMGLGHMVFPGAEHSRLVHSLGASFVAIRFGKRLAEDARGVLTGVLRPDPEAIRDLAVAALCHDIGHGPLSHAWEDKVIGGSGYDLGAWCGQLGLDLQGYVARPPKWHELVGQALLTWEDGELHSLLEQHSAGFSERIRSLLSGTYYLPYFPGLLDSDVDADRADFLLRDSHSCGVRYGRLDLDWLISTMAVGFDGGDRLVSGFDRRKAPKVVEQFLIARGAMYDTVYHHKTVRSVEGMVGMFLGRVRSLAPDLLERLLEGGRVFAPFARALSGEALPPEDVLPLDDFGLWMLIEYVAQLSRNRFDPTACDLAVRISKRDLFKSVPLESNRIQDFLLRPDATDLLHDAVESSYPGDPQYYVFRDIASVSLLEPVGAHSGHLIDGSRVAEPLSYCPELAHLPPGSRSVVRLFTIREALEEVTTLVSRS